MVTDGVGITDQVEPELGQSLGVVWASQDPVDHALIGVGPDIGEELGKFLWPWRQAGQVQIQAAEQGRPVGLGRG